MLGSNYTSFKFEVLTAGDVTFKFCNCLVKTITIEEGVEKKPCKYKVVAGYTEDEKTTILKELVAENVPPRTVDINLKAYELGYNM